jgi:hypothetical protein
MRTNYLTKDETFRIMVNEDRKRRMRRAVETKECPQGLTESELQGLFGERLHEFNFWMRGQTMGVCEGRRYHHDRCHDRFCLQEFRPGTKWSQPAHTEDSEWDWRCGYTGTGYYEPTECVYNPHGVVAYPWDVERFLLGLPVIDLCCLLTSASSTRGTGMPARQRCTGLTGSA